MVNVELLNRVLQYIKSHPEEWHQVDWYRHDEAFLLSSPAYKKANNPCKTAFCFAGHAALMAGFPPPPEVGPWMSSDSVHVADFARDQLGLTPDQSNILFSPFNTFDELEILVGFLTEHPDATGYEMERRYVEIRLID